MKYPFSGNFDGNYHTITGLYINRNLDFQGFIGSGNLDRSTIVSNIGMINVDITARDYVGGLVGANGTITDSYSTVDVTGNQSVGGISGSSGNITTSYSTGTVHGDGRNVVCCERK